MSIRMRTAVLALGLLAAPLAAHAADTTLVLDVHHAGCVLCGPIVQRTLAGTKGVHAVAVSQPDGMADVAATVTFDPARVTPATLIRALTDQGYPAQVAAAKGR